MRSSIDTAQQLSVTSSTPGAIDAYLDALFPGVTERVSREDRRAIVLASTELALDATLSSLLDKHMRKVEKAWAEDES